MCTFIMVEWCDGYRTHKRAAPSCSPRRPKDAWRSEAEREARVWRVAGIVLFLVVLWPVHELQPTHSGYFYRYFDFCIEQRDGAF